VKRRLSVVLSVVMILSLVLSAFPFGAAMAATTVKITLLETSDVHGAIYPYDYFKDAASNGGLAQLSTIVKGVRAENPNTLLLDDGDNQQGTPLTYYFNKVETTAPNPMIAAMNLMGYDAMTLGNHEFNYGLGVVDKARSEAKFPWLSANIYKDDGTNYFTPYIVKTVAGVKVGILGLTTKNIPNWEVPGNIKGLVFKDTVSEAEKWVKVLKETEKVDLVVVLAHEGFEDDIDTGKDLGHCYRERMLCHSNDRSWYRCPAYRTHAPLDSGQDTQRRFGHAAQERRRGDLPGRHYNGADCYGLEGREQVGNQCSCN